MVSAKLQMWWHNIKDSKCLIAGLTCLLRKKSILQILLHSLAEIWNQKSVESQKLQAAWCAHHGQARLDPQHLSQEWPTVFLLLAENEDSKHPS